MPKSLSWSFSSINEYEICPYKHHTISILKKIKDVWSDEANKGIADHEKLEHRLLHKKPLPKNLAKFERVCQIIENGLGELHPETKFCLDRQLKPTRYKDWKNGWYRGVIDILKVNNTKAWVGDWKTGKEKFDFSQLELFAAIVFIFYPKVTEITANYIWLKTGALSATQHYTRQDSALTWSRELARVMAREQANQTNHWPTTVNGLCKSYCIINALGKCPDVNVPQHTPKK